MIDVVGRRPAPAGKTESSTATCTGRRLLGTALFACLLPLPIAAQNATGEQQTVTTTPAPQIITVPVPSAAPGYTSTGPDWSRASDAQGSATRQVRTDDDRMRSSATSRPADEPTEFQLLVSQTLGRTLPIFGDDIFSNPASTFTPVADAQVTPDYVIGSGDEIRISATGQLNQQGTFRVDRAGTISIPDVGTLTVAGLRFSDLKPFLSQQIGRVYRNFELNVTLGQLRSIQIYILGQARQPGAYTVSSLSTLVNAIFVSGGIRPQGSLRHIELRRGDRAVTTLDLYDLLLRGDKSKDVPLQPGDTIFIPTAGPQIAITGSVTNPAIYELLGPTSLDRAIQLANGLTSTANATSIRVESVSGGTERAIENVSAQTNGSMVVRGGDIVTVQAISDQFKDAVTLRGNVANPGRYGWHPGMRVSDLIPDRASLITRNYYRSRNVLGQQAANFQPAQTVQATQGRVAVSTAPAANAQPGASTATGANTAPGRGEQPTPTTTDTASSNAGGTTVGDALTQNNGTFSSTNELILSAPDVDLAYAVVERLDPANLSTSLIPFNLGAVLNHTDPSQNLPLEPGDVVTIFSKADIRVPQSQQTRYVRLEGEFVAAGVYSVYPGETLRQLVMRAGGLTSDAYLYASEFTRQSTRRVEQQRLREYADSLDARISSESSRQIAQSIDPASTAQTANITAENARAAVARLRAIQPSGRIVLKLSPTSSGIDSVPDLALEDGDRFIVPRQPSTVNVAGEVYNASAFLYEPNLQVRNYVRDAGGPSRDADDKRIFVIRADGSVVSKQYSNVSKASSLPGDTVVVPPQLTRRNLLRDIVAISSIAGQVATPLSLIAILK